MISKKQINDWCDDIVQQFHPEKVVLFGSCARQKYRKFVEGGIAQSDEEFMQIKDTSPHTIGSLEFDCRVRRLYKALVEESGVTKDVAFREQVEAIPPDVVVDAVCKVFGVDKEYICTRQRGRCPSR